MILILSHDGLEPTTDDVVDWIRALGGDCARLNTADLVDAPLRMELTTDGPVVRFTAGGREVVDREVEVVWLRRWGGAGQGGITAVPGCEEVAAKLRAHMAAEATAVSRGFFALFRHARWLTRPHEAALSKLHVLHAAAQAGLDVPATLVTNQRAEIEAFRLRHGRIITKSVGEMASFAVDGRYFGTYTAEVTAAESAAAPESLFPSLVQEMVEKDVELRVFYLDGRTYSMAIFSQADAQTEVDFRQYNTERPNRRVPYRLPAQVEAAVCRLMEDLGLTTGSIDLIRTPGGRHVFLEVNPAGQFGMVSVPCNYHLERRVAEYLMAGAADVHG